MIRTPQTPATSGDAPPTPGVVLAGGLARRMGGGDKAMRRIGGRTLLARVVGRLVPQCDRLVLSANGDPARFGDVGLAVIPDTVSNHPGPLAGILAALDWTATSRPDAAWVLSVAADCPFLPRDLVVRLHRARVDQDAELAVAASGGRPHPVIGLWPVGLRAALRRALVEEDVRKVGRFAARYRVATASWPAEPVDPFFNVNTIADVAAAERLAQLDGG